MRQMRKEMAYASRVTVQKGRIAVKSSLADRADRVSWGPMSTRSILVAGALCLGLGSLAHAQEPAAAARPCALEPGVRELTIDVDGSERRYWVSVGPQAARAASPPVIFLWHGFGS